MLILRNSPRHPGIETGSPMTWCCVRESISVGDAMILRGIVYSKLAVNVPLIQIFPGSHRKKMITDQIEETLSK